VADTDPGASDSVQGTDSLISSMLLQEVPALVNHACCNQSNHI
jgi:hypothetical protein